MSAHPLGETVELTVGPVAHGGHCVARLPGPSDADGPGQVVFVRHALPGERVRAIVTERRRGYLRADAVEVLRASPDRVPPPCRYAGRCGGCDFQHVAPAAQLELKAAVVREQLTRLARLTAAEVDALGVRVQPLPGGALGWRSRVQYTVDGSGRLGFFRHRSHRVLAVERCLIAHPCIQELPLTRRRWPRRTASVEAVASATGDVAVLERRPDGSLASGGQVVGERAAGREWTVAADTFWQVHPAAPDTLAATVVDLLQPRPGERAWDLYGGAGLFAVALAPRLGPGGRVTVVESAANATDAARRCLADLPQVGVVATPVERALPALSPDGVDLVVLDPPRAGAGAEVVRGVTAARPRAVAYVSCDPATFARDVAVFGEQGYRLVQLRAYDAFPMTHHVEVVGLLVRAVHPGPAREDP